MFWIKQKENNLPKGKADEAISGVLQHAFVSVICLSSKWVGIQFPKYITLFLLKHIPPITTC